MGARYTGSHAYTHRHKTRVCRGKTRRDELEYWHIFAELVVRARHAYCTYTVCCQSCRIKFRRAQLVPAFAVPLTQCRARASGRESATESWAFCDYKFYRGLIDALRNVHSGFYKKLPCHRHDGRANIKVLRSGFIKFQ